MKKSVLLVCSMLLFSLRGIGQKTISGFVYDSETKAPIAFTNIGVENTSVGTLSDEDGSFSITIPEWNQQILAFSALGYDRVDLPIANLNDSSGISIYLRNIPMALETVEIVIERERQKRFSLGNGQSNGASLYADTIHAGSAMALLIENPGGKNIDYPVFLQKAQVQIVNNTFSEFKIRTRVYDVDSITGLPGKDLLNESVVSRSRIKNGWLKVDLSKYQLQINSDFFIVFEWILDSKERVFLYQQYRKYFRNNPERVKFRRATVAGKSIPYIDYGGDFYAGTSFGISNSAFDLRDHISFYRLNSLGEWRRSSSILTAKVHLSNRKILEEDFEIESGAEALSESLSFHKIGFNASLSIDDPIPVTANSFYARRDEPVSVFVVRKDGAIEFVARNRSQYPYVLHMNFDNMRNLHPMKSKDTVLLNPGLNSLFHLSIVLAEDQYHYELSVEEKIGNPNLSADLEYPYLIPGMLESVIEKGESLTTDVSDSFRSPVDSIYVMRKGIVTALPNGEENFDRVDENALEVYHSDGTVMVYKNLDFLSLKVKKGETVYPGQQIGRVLPGTDPSVAAYRFDGDGRLERLEISYVITEDLVLKYAEMEAGVFVVHPEEVIKRELSKREQLRYRENRLYQK
ncbi:MAG: carboxypeptidase-like regulatory domain-containing protein [Cyclobacteriaceae bacterium]